MFAVSRSTAFAVAINQAGGAGAWNISAELRTALMAAAEKAETPALLMVAQNDRTTDSITTLAEIYKKRGVPHRMVIYEPFTPQSTARVATEAPDTTCSGLQACMCGKRTCLNSWPATSARHLPAPTWLIQRSRGMMADNGHYTRYHTGIRILVSFGFACSGSTTSVNVVAITVRFCSIEGEN